MLVTLHFEKNGVDYRIHRKDVVHLQKSYVNNEEQE